MVPLERSVQCPISEKHIRRTPAALCSGWGSQWIGKAMFGMCEEVAQWSEIGKLAAIRRHAINSDRKRSAVYLPSRHCNMTEEKWETAVEHNSKIFRDFCRFDKLHLSNADQDITEGYPKARRTQTRIGSRKVPISFVKYPKGGSSLLSIQKYYQPQSNRREQARNYRR